MSCNSPFQGSFEYKYFVTIFWKSRFLKIHLKDNQLLEKSDQNVECPNLYD